MEIGELVRQHRLARKMTQADLAGPEYSKTFISRIESGNLIPSLRALEVIARRLGVPLATFVGDAWEASRRANRLERRAQHAREQRRWNEWRDLTSEALDIARSYAMHDLVGKLLRELGDGFYEQERWDDAIDAYLSAFAKINPEDANSLAAVHRKLGAGYFMQEEYLLARRHYHMALEFVSQQSDDFIRLQTNLATAYMCQNLYDQAASCYRVAIKHASDLGYAQLKLDAEFGLGALEMRRKHYSDAIPWLKDALAIAESSDATSLVKSGIRVNMAICAYYCAQDTTAITILNDAVSRWIAEDQWLHVGEAAEALASIYLEQAAWESAIQLGQEVVPLLIAHHIRYAAARLLEVSGRCFLEKQSLEDARAMLSQSYGMYVATNRYDAAKRVDQLLKMVSTG